MTTGSPSSVSNGTVKRVITSNTLEGFKQRRHFVKCYDRVVSSDTKALTRRLPLSLLWDGLEALRYDAILAALIKSSVGRPDHSPNLWARTDCSGGADVLKNLNRH